MRTQRKKAASHNIKTYRLTPGERMDLAWLAKHRGVDESDVLRSLVQEALDRLVAAGVKVPRR